MSKLASIAMAAYVSLTSMLAVRPIIYSDCGLGRDQPYFDL